MSTARYITRLAIAALVLCAMAAAGIAVLVAQATPHAPAERPAAALVAPAPVEAPADLPGGAHTDDEAFLADLLGPDTDATPGEVLMLTEQGRRYCALVVEGLTVPGAEAQTRDGWLTGLTMAGDPHALTLDEAGKLLDVAEAVYCPQARA
jgi:hypothetical protein